MLEGVETYGGRIGGVWERWRSVVGGVGVSVSVREVEVCGRGGGVWERWRCVREVEKCGGRVGGVLKEWRRMVVGFEVCWRGGEVWWEGWG